MRTLILAGVLIALVTTPAFACRGIAEYPEAASDIAQSMLTPERKKELLDQLGVGNALHKQDRPAMKLSAFLSNRMAMRR